jgi:pteridine reductase
METLAGKSVLITGAARRIGRSLSLAVAKAGADVVIHYGQSQVEAEELAAEIRNLGRNARIVQADLGDETKSVGIFKSIFSEQPVDALINNAAIFDPLKFQNTQLDDWNRTLGVNLTIPFLLSQAFSQSLAENKPGRIINLLDWRALRPGYDHFAYTISKAGLAALTHSMALALAPRITVNGIALGAILPPSDGGNLDKILEKVPAKRWADMDELTSLAVYLLSDASSYITGEIIHLDGGRHLV